MSRNALIQIIVAVAYRIMAQKRDSAGFIEYRLPYWLHERAVILNIIWPAAIRITLMITCAVIKLMAIYSILMLQLKNRFRSVELNGKGYHCEWYCP